MQRYSKAGPLRVRPCREKAVACLSLIQNPEPLAPLLFVLFGVLMQLALP